MINETIKKYLLGTKREGIEDLVEYMERVGFFTAPCSGQYHLCKEGGLAEHSLNVLIEAEHIAAALLTKAEYKKMHEAIVISALLHDLGKTGQFLKPMYVPNMVQDGRPTKANPEQKYKQSTSKPYATNKELLNIPHCVRSIAIAMQYIDLTEEEQTAILYHDGLYGELKYSIPGHETPLSLIIHWADLWSAKVKEVA